MYLKIVRMNDSPPRVALGVAIGVFLGIFPTFGLGIVLAFAVAWVLGANRVASLVGSLIMNPLTTPFFWTISALFGAWITGLHKDIIMNDLKTGMIFKALGPSVYAYMIGNLIISIVFAVASYYFTLLILKTHKKNKKL